MFSFTAVPKMYDSDGDEDERKKEKCVTSFHQAFLDNEEFYDVIFFVGLCPESTCRPVDKNKLMRIPAHKCVLATASPLFAQMFSQDGQGVQEIIVDDTEPIVFLLLLRYLILFN